ncbi:MAG: ion channel [Mariprofundaceae bacterium]|nr:ion channel [Mariprofundaceae bacterium]
MRKQYKEYLNQGLDILLFVLTVLIIALSFWDKAPEWVQIACLSSFFIVFALRWWLAEDRKAHIRSNWIDLALMVILSSPLLRLFMFFRFLIPAIQIAAVIRTQRRHLVRMLMLSSESFPTAMALLFTVTFIAGLSIFLVEHDINPLFNDISDGLWWAFVTLTSVGYGDVYPITGVGRIIAVITMLFGMMVYSLVIANLTRVLIAEDNTPKDPENKKVRPEENNEKPTP